MRRGSNVDPRREIFTDKTLPELEAFDALPKIIQVALREAYSNYSAAQCYDAWRGGYPAALIASGIRQEGAADAAAVRRELEKYSALSAHGRSR